MFWINEQIEGWKQRGQDWERKGRAGKEDIIEKRERTGCVQGTVWGRVRQLWCLCYKLVNVSEPQVLFVKHHKVDLPGLTWEVKVMMYGQTCSVEEVDALQGDRLTGLPWIHYHCDQTRVHGVEPFQTWEYLGLVLITLHLFPDESLHENGWSTRTVCHGRVIHPPQLWSSWENPVHSVLF